MLGTPALANIAPYKHTHYTDLMIDAMMPMMTRKRKNGIDAVLPYSRCAYIGTEKQ